MPVVSETPSALHMGICRADAPCRRGVVFIDGRCGELVAWASDSNYLQRSSLIDDQAVLASVVHQRSSVCRQTMPDKKPPRRRRPETFQLLASCLGSLFARFLLFCTLKAPLYSVEDAMLDPEGPQAHSLCFSSTSIGSNTWLEHLENRCEKQGIASPR